MKNKKKEHVNDVLTAHQSITHAQREYILTFRENGIKWDTILSKPSASYVFSLDSIYSFVGEGGDSSVL